MVVSLKGNLMRETTCVAKKTTEASAPEESVSGYFRRLFEERPELLGSGSNKELFERWLQDHPGKRTVPNRVKNILSNVKSIVRKKRRKAGRKKAAQPTPIAQQATTLPIGLLEPLEERIDDCLTLARNSDRERLAEVILLLRKARNAVVWKMGE
jgi:hypothetical protein